MPNLPVRKWLQMGFVCLLAVMMLGASQAPDNGARFDRVGHKMMCVCGCGQVLLDCNHVGCPDSSRMIGELREQMSGPNGTGADSLIINWFIAKYGATVLAAPIRGGFDNVAWGIPVALFLLATIGTALLVRLWAKRSAGTALAGGLPSLPGAAGADALRERIRRETEY